MAKSNIIFDLDGTLIDSSGSILASFAHAFRVLGLEPKRALTPELIGPPLMQTLAILSGTQEQSVLEALAYQFKSHYDAEGCKQATVFAGVVDMLEAITVSNANLYIATNKRLYPTQKIMQHLGWKKYFSKVFALDYFTPAVANKKQMIRRMLADEHILPTSAIYIGDRYEDGVAADENELEFAMVSWGYLDDTVGDIPAHWHLYETPYALAQRFTG